MGTSQNLQGPWKKIRAAVLISNSPLLKTGIKHEGFIYSYSYPFIHQMAYECLVGLTYKFDQKKSDLRSGGKKDNYRKRKSPSTLK